MSFHIPQKKLLMPGKIILDNDAKLLVDAMPVKPSIKRQLLISKTIKSLKSNNIWDKLGKLWVMAAHSGSAARLNWITRDTLPMNGNAIFTQDQGFTAGTDHLYYDASFAGDNTSVGCGYYRPNAFSDAKGLFGSYEPNSAQHFFWYDAYTNRPPEVLFKSFRQSYPGGYAGPDFISLCSGSVEINLRWNGTSNNYAPLGSGFTVNHRMGVNCIINNNTYGVDSFAPNVVFQYHFRGQYMTGSQTGTLRGIMSDYLAGL